MRSAIECLLPLLLLVGGAESFVANPRNQMAVKTSRLGFKLDSQHEDHVIPDEIRAERSKQIRDKLLGDENDGSATTATKLKSKSNKNKKKRGGDPHAILHRLTQLFDEHLLDMEDFDRNA